MTTCEDTLYEVLGLTPTATTAEIKAAYLRLARLTHPDVGGTASLFRRVEEAHATLSKPRVAGPTTSPWAISGSTSGTGKRRRRIDGRGLVARVRAPAAFVGGRGSA